MSSSFAPVNSRPLPQVPSTLGSPVKRDPVIDRSQVPKEVIQVAQGFEEMFLDYLMKTMRDTVHDSSMSLESHGTKIYRSMLDNEYTKKAIAAGGVGVADQLIAYMAPQLYNLRDAPQGKGMQMVRPESSQGARVTTEDPKSTGGTYEGQLIKHSSNSSSGVADGQEIK